MKESKIDGAKQFPKCELQLLFPKCELQLLFPKCELAAAPSAEGFAQLQLGAAEILFYILLLLLRRGHP